MHRADLADEVRSELVHHAVDRNQLPPKQLCRRGIVGPMLTVVGKRYCWIDLIGRRLDIDRDAHFVVSADGFGIEIGDGLGFQRHLPGLAIAGPNV
jgi:hypothetical protein